ncbi:MAG: hypothetical protein P1U89_21195 [Verrucomicrobiales bacterium]|nr:hypothetical protein [Verrucomicrobiales bacterium]
MSQITDDEALQIAAQKTLQDGGSAANLLELSIPPRICLEVGLDISDLREAGYKAEHLKNDEITAIDAKEGGYTADELREAYTAPEVEGCYGAEDFFPDQVEAASETISDLSGKVELNQNAVEQVDEIVANAREALASLATEMRAAIEGMNQQINQAEQTLEDDVTTTTQNLEDLSGKILELESTVDSSIDEIATRMTLVETTCDEAESTLEAGITQVKTQQETFTAFLDTFRQTANSLIDEESSRLDDFTSKAGELAGTISELQENTTTEFGNLESALNDRLATAQQEFDQFNNFFSSARDTTLGVVTEGTVGKLAEFQTQYLDQIVGTVDTSVETANGALQTFAAVGEGCSDLLEGELGDVIDTVNGLVDTIDPVIEVLEVAQDIL